MTRYYYGCDEIPQGWKSYYRRCTALELDLAGHEHPPTIKTLNRWRVESPRGFSFVLHLDAGANEALQAAASRGATELGEDFEQGWARTVEQAHALAARAILVKTPLSFGPAAETRALMSALGERARELKQALIWEASGVWGTEATRDWAEEHGIIYAIDPFLAQRDEIAPGKQDGCFILNERAAMRRKFDQYDIEDLLDWSSTYQRVFILLRGRFKWDHARELQYVLEHR